jgi:YhcH/YjgK/YiaL family protein
MDCVNIKSYVPYQGECENLKRAINWLSKQDLDKIECGKYEIDGKNIFASVSEYETKDSVNCRYEFHKKYIDIQLLIGGKEIINVTTIDNIDVTDDYNESKDIAFGILKDENLENRLIMTEGLAAILYPKDAHQPNMRIVDNNSINKKIVVKVAI